jgi:CDP-diacylglycerol--glycerol-3-phosphate 3-phosphatidyltransferase
MVSELGAKLDSLGDLALYLTVPLCAWWLWPEIIKRESFFVLLAIGAYCVPILFVFVKFGKMSSYHTWATKI